jgi:type VI secretion system FHA domain protein
MTLTLAISNVAMLDNGMPTEFVMHKRGAVIGRAATCDWCLPDPRNHISSRHCEVRFDGGTYMFSDCSTNGTYLNGASERMTAPRRIEDGDRFQIGHYDIRARLTGDAYTAADRAPPAPAPAEWRGWDAGFESPAGNTPPPSSASTSGWDSSPPPPQHGGARWQPALSPAISPRQPYQASPPAVAPEPRGGSGWAPSHRAPDLPTASTWESPAPATDPASSWSSSAPDRPPAPSPDDVWGRIAEGNVVDWARGGFGQAVEPARDPLGLSPASTLPEKPPVPRASGPNGSDWGRPASAPAAPAASRADAAAPFLAGVGLTANKLTDASPATLERAGGLFRRLVAGLVVMVEARARAKAQLGAETTAFSVEGNNPIKYARTPDEALALLLNPAQSGFMDPSRAIEDAFLDLQSHQMATLRAMQGALKATLDRFSPAAIRNRAEAKGLLERIVPTAREAALWQAYEREFGGVVQGSDEAFMDVFAKEFRRAYNEQARRPD